MQKLKIHIKKRQRASNGNHKIKANTRALSKRQLDNVIRRTKKEYGAALKKLAKT